MSYLAHDIANYILDRAEERGFAPSNMWINKALFFAHSMSLKEKGEPLLKNEFLAWQYGPVIRPIYEQFKKFGDGPIKDFRALRLDPFQGKEVYVAYSIAPEDKDFIDEALSVLMHHSASSLMQKSHERGSAWEVIWNEASKGVVPGMRIPNDLIIETAFRWEG